MISDSPPTDLPAASPLRSHKNLWTSLLVFLLSLVYKPNLRPIAAGDSYPARCLSFGIWRCCRVCFCTRDDGNSRMRPARYDKVLTASVRRFYLSEEIGHALWLTLYLENTHRSGGVM
jgi:hypothetical protein